MIYTHEELQDGAQAIGRLLNSCDAVVRYGYSRITTIVSFVKSLFFQELNHYNTFIRE